jgi:hypothetical protein
MIEYFVNGKNCIGDSLGIDGTDDIRIKYYNSINKNLSEVGIDENDILNYISKNYLENNVLSINYQSFYIYNPNTNFTKECFRILIRYDNYDFCVYSEISDKFLLNKIFINLDKKTITRDLTISKILAST